MLYQAFKSNLSEMSLNDKILRLENATNEKLVNIHLWNT